jgi:hypothetical protein
MLEPLRLRMAWQTRYVVDERHGGEFEHLDNEDKKDHNQTAQDNLLAESQENCTKEA